VNKRVRVGGEGRGAGGVALPSDAASPAVLSVLCCSGVGVDCLTAAMLAKSTAPLVKLFRQAPVKRIFCLLLADSRCC
jgi:hypothetical protein